VFRAYSNEFIIPHGTEEIVSRPQTLIRLSEPEGAKLFFTLLTNAFVTALLCLVFWLLLRDFGLSQRGALAGTALLAFATPVWVYARDFFSEPMFAVCLLTNFYLLKGGGTESRQDEAGGGGGRRVVLAGLISSLGMLARASFIPLAGIFAAYLVLASDDRTEGARAAMRYLIFCVPGLAALGVLNLVRFGSPFMTGYHTAFDRGFSVPLLKGLAWNIASPYRSLFLYAPATLLLFFGAIHFARRYKKQFILILGIVAYVFVVYSKWWAWHGGWCWGPRFLVPVIPLLLIPGLTAVSARGRWLLVMSAFLGLAGFIVQIGGVLINYTAAYDYWIKIGKLDWAEAGIELYPAVTTHLRALAVTSPWNYDLWLVQAYKVNPAAIGVLAAALIAAALGAAWPVLRNGVHGE
jgi:hypothetical protein